MVTANRKHAATTLTRFRRLSGMSQTQLAFLCAIHPSHISKIESGTRFPSQDMVSLLSSGLGLTDDETRLFHLTAGFVPPMGLPSQDSPGLRDAILSCAKLLETLDSVSPGTDVRWLADTLDSWHRLLVLEVNSENNDGGPVPVGYGAGSSKDQA